MTRLRRTVLWACLVGIGVLAALSVAGAFLGSGRARLFFNSIPLSVFWVLLTGLLIAGMALFRRLARSPGLLAAHLGCLLVLIGSIVASDSGHRLTNRLSGRAKTPAGKMILFEGESSNRLFSLGGGEGAEVIGQLPFSVELRDFWIEYYGPWSLVADEDGRGARRPPRGIAWTVGEEVAVPDTEARLTVLRYIEGSRPVYGEDAEPVLEITRPGGQPITVPAEVGESLSIEDPDIKIQIVKVFSHLRVEGVGDDMRVIDVPGLSENPALAVQTEHPDGTIHRWYVLPDLPVRHWEGALVDLRYLARGEPIAATADPESKLPAMEVLVRYRGREWRRWLIAQEGDRVARLFLGDLPAEADDGEVPVQRRHRLALYLVEPSRFVRDFKSDLAVFEEGEERARKTIEVNDPLHYGGYHFYQQSYDEEHGRYTVLAVRSDSGLPIVYAGFFLVGAGIAWLFWAQPAWGYLARRRDDGD